MEKDILTPSYVLALVIDWTHIKKNNKKKTISNWLFVENFLNFFKIIVELLLHGCLFTLNASTFNCCVMYRSTAP